MLNLHPRVPCNTTLDWKDITPTKCTRVVSSGVGAKRGFHFNQDDLFLSLKMSRSKQGKGLMFAGCRWWIFGCLFFPVFLNFQKGIYKEAEISHWKLVQTSGVSTSRSYEHGRFKFSYILKIFSNFQQWVYVAFTIKENNTLKHSIWNTQCLSLGEEMWIEIHIKHKH